MDPKKKNKPQQQVNELVAALCGMAEMAHSVYNAMIQSGASAREAEVAMTGWISAFWHESMQDARRNKQTEAQDDGEA